MGLLILFIAAGLVLLVIITVMVMLRMRRPPRRTIGAALAHGWPLDPADAELEAEDVRFTLADGHTTPGWIIEGGQPDGVVLIYTHGWSDSRYRALGVAGARLIPMVRKLVLYDVRAHGESSAPISYAGTREIADLEGIIDQVLEHTDGPIVLMGHSMGAGISLGVAARDTRSRITGLILEGIYRHWLPPITGLLRYWGFPTQPIGWLIWCYARIAAPYLFDHFDRAQLAKQVRCPAMLIHTEDDWLCDIADARAVAQALPDAQTVIFNIGGHIDLAAENLPDYLAHLRGFLERIENRNERHNTEERGE